MMLLLEVSCSCLSEGLLKHTCSDIKGQGEIGSSSRVIAVTRRKAFHSAGEPHFSVEHFLHSLRMANAVTVSSVFTRLIFFHNTEYTIAKIASVSQARKDMVTAIYEQEDQNLLARSSCHGSEFTADGYDPYRNTRDAHSILDIRHLSPDTLPLVDLSVAVPMELTQPN